MATHTSLQLLIATHNAGKVKELRSLLAGLPVCLRSLQEFARIPEVVETGATFADNAALKAVAYAQATQLLALADDSGLEVEALDGAPGVLSARYAGENATDAERTARLLHNLDSTGDKSRRARFVCAIAIADPNGNLIYASQGICAGHIAARPSGTGGFGYDPIFVPDNYDESFASLPPAIKEQISHRARALQSARAFLLDYLRSTKLDRQLNRPLE